MPDDLDRAVDARIDACTPRTHPPFEALVGRKRARARRRAVAGGAALSATAVAVALVVVPSPGIGGDRLVPEPSAAPGGPGADGPQVRQYAVSNRSDTGYQVDVRETDEGIRRCLDLPGVTDRGTGEKMPVDYAATVDGIERAEQFEACIRAVPRAVASARPPAADDPAPGSVAWTGATVCLTGGDEDLCREVDAARARELQSVLDRAVLSTGGGGDCASDPRSYRVQFLHPAIRTAPTDVPLSCGFVTRGAGSGNYRLDGSARDQVKQAYDAAVPARTAAFIERCVSDEQQHLAPELLGLTEEGLQARLREEDVPHRLVGRDGECLGRLRDLRPERVNVLVEDGRVVWAGRF